MTDNIRCMSCKKDKFQLHFKSSELLPGIQLFLCQSCLDLGYEPRFVVILAGRQNGPAAVKKFIKPKRYIGEEIYATELLK